MCIRYVWEVTKRRRKRRFSISQPDWIYRSFCFCVHMHSHFVKKTTRKQVRKATYTHLQSLFFRRSKNVEDDRYFLLSVSFFSRKEERATKRNEHIESTTFQVDVMILGRQRRRAFDMNYKGENFDNLNVGAKLRQNQNHRHRSTKRN